ncbi:MAG: hypothetical protein WCQ10_07245 [Chitinophagia bacterium]
MKINKLKDNKGFAHVEALIIIMVLIVTVSIGGYVYQNNVGTNYKKNIVPAFTNQGEQMKVVAESFNRPVWTSNTTTSDSDTNDFAYINPNITKAVILTNKLSDDNKPLILPGATLFGSGKKLKNSQTSMSIYISDSYAFLKDYQALSTYAQQTEKIQAGMGAVLTSLDQSASATSPAQIAELYKTDVQGLDTVIAAYKKLTPPADLVSLNSKLITALSSLRTYMSNSITDINTNNAASLYTDSNGLIAASGTLISISGTDVTAQLQGKSIIHGQIVKLNADAEKIKSQN